MAALWPDIARAYGWVHRAAHILNNRGEEDARLVRRRFDGLVAAMHRHRGKAGTLADAIGHFRKVARSDRPRLFPCYAVPGLPRTNNDLEHLFGAQRYHERGAGGRKAPSPAPVLGGGGAHDRGHGDAAAPTRRGRAGSGQPGAMDRTPPASRRPAAGPDPAHPLPPQPGCLPGRLGTASVPASFADLVFLNASRSSGVAAAGWRGRGFCTDQPIAFRASQPRWGETSTSPSSRAIQAATFGLVHKPPSGGGSRRRALSFSSRSGLRTEGLVPLRQRRSPRACGPWAL